MPINWGLMDTQYPARLADLFNPASMQARNAEIEGRNSANLMRQAQALQAAQQLQRAPELARREDLQWKMQQDEVARKNLTMGVLRDPNATPEQKKQALVELFPEKAAEQILKPNVRDFNQPFNPDGTPNVAYQKWKLAEQRAGKEGETPTLKLARERFEWEKSGGKSDAKPLPTTALKLQQEELDAIGTASALNKDLASFQNKIVSGKMPLGLVTNLGYKARNIAGQSTEESRNYASFQANLERLRNESLRLNKGVQTEGDAVRAWNEILANINDPELVKQRLGEVQKVNERAVLLRKMNVDAIRANYGKDPLDVSGRENVTSAYENDDAEALAWARENPNDPRAAQIMSLHGR